MFSNLDFDYCEIAPFRLGVLGVNHKSASLGLREMLARAFEERFQVISGLPTIVLSTCNRTEVYFSSSDLVATHSQLLQLLRGAVSEEFEHSLYSYFGTNAFHHLARVTAGLDSAVLGETEIQGQVKTGYEAAHQAAELPKELHYIFQKSLKIGKEVRTKILIDKGIPDLPGAVHKMGGMVLDSLLSCSVLFIGASEINLKVLRYLRLRGLRDITLCNRTLSRAQELCRKEEMRCLSWDQIGLWPTFDWVIVGTKAGDHLINRSDIQGPFEQKKLVMDLSLPRNVAPCLGTVENLLLLNIDQINHAVDTKRAESAGLFRAAEQRVTESVQRQVALYRARESHRLQLA